MSKKIGIIVKSERYNSAHYNALMLFEKEIKPIDWSTANPKARSVKEIMRRFKAKTGLLYRDTVIYVVNQQQFEQLFGTDTASALTLLKLTINGFDPKAYFDWDLLALSDNDKARLQSEAIEQAKSVADEAYQEYRRNFEAESKWWKSGKFNGPKFNVPHYWNNYKEKRKVLNDLQKQALKQCFSELVFLTE